MNKKIIKYLHTKITFVSISKQIEFIAAYCIFFLTIAFTASGQVVAQTYTASGTFTVPAGVTEITVECWGGGGGGGGSSINGSGGSGGGGGGYTTAALTVTPGQVIPVTVGTGGAAGAAAGGNGGNGSATTFLSLTANGGTGGVGNAGALGTGGTATGGTTNLTGGNGTAGGGSGGNGGNGANGGTGGIGATNGVGGNGNPPGGGGGGGERMNTGGSRDRAGGTGASGQVIVSWIPPYLAVFTAMNIGSATWEINETREVSVTVTNAGTATWTDAAPDINIGVKWNADPDYLVRVNANGLAPGASQTYYLTITAPATSGSENLTFDVVNELDCWFGNNNGSCGPGNTVYTSPALTITAVYYSQNSGNPGTLANWNSNPIGGGSQPANFTANYQQFVVQNGHNMSTTGNWTVSGTGSGVIIGNGASVINTNHTLTLASLIVEDGGTYTHAQNGGALPAATWGATSNCIVTGITNNALTTLAADQNFGNFTWNCPAQTIVQTLLGAGISCTFQGNLSVLRTNTGSLSLNAGNGTPTHRIVGDLTVGDGANTSTLNLKSGGTGEVNIELGGNLTVNTNGTLTRTDAGTASFYFGYTGATTTSAVTWGGSGTFTNTSISYIIQDIPVGKTVTLTNAMTIPAGRSITFNNGTLLCGANIISGAGTFNLSAGATIGTTDAGGIASTGATGSIRTTTRTYNAAANYIYSGITAQVIGNGPTAAANLTINNTSGVTLSGNLTVSNTLNLDNGNLSLGSGAANLTIANGATITTPGSFDNMHMIVCDGTGSLIKQSTTAADLVRVYPVGTNGFYTPFEITSLSATVTGTGSLNVRAAAGTAGGPPPAGSTDLQKYWVITSPNLSAINAGLSFTYINPNEVGTGGDQTSYQPYIYSGGAWSMPSGVSGGGVNPMTVAGINTIAGTWTGREGPKTYYSYQSGNWGTATTWTTDPSGTLSVSPGIPGAMDRAVILNGRTVTITTNSIAALSTQINEGGFLDIGNTTLHNLGDVRGKGWMRLSTGTFPNGIFADFVGADGGTVEYYNTADFNLSQLTYNHLIFNLSTNAIIATILGNLTVNGNLTIRQGTFRINNNAATNRLDLTVYGDVLVEANGLIRVGTGNIGTTATDAHRFIIQGNLTNNGDVRFTNLAAANYFTYPNHRVDVVFNSSNADQVISLNGYSRFYRIEIDKGVDQTYILNIDATAAGMFFLFGRNDLMGVTPAPDAPNINNLNALGLMTGTVRLGANINLPSLAEESAAGMDLNYHVDEDACLWIDGANVTHTTNANGGNSNSFVLYGKLRISNPSSTFNINNLHGIVMRANAAVEVEDGTLTVPCIRTSTVAGTHRGSYSQTGGTVTITGNIAGSGDHASLSLTWPGMSFSMAGGNLNINQAASVGGNGQLRSLVIGANSENISVTGGTVTLSILNRNAYFTSTAPFWNLIITAPNTTYSSQIVAFTGSGSASAVAVQPLVVLNNFSLTNSAIFIPNNQNVTVGSNFTLEAAATYTPGTNTTTFNGNSGQIFNNAGTITGPGLYNLGIINSSNTSITQNLTIRNNLVINNGCFLQDMGRTVSVAANITNSGTHTSQAGGSITLNSGVAQTIGGDGSGVFGNLAINKTGGSATLTANQSLTGNLRLANNGLLNAGIYRLSLGAGSNVYDALYPATTAVFSGTKMIRTAGNMSDGGVTKEYNSTTAFVFPVGTGGDYTPASIQFTSAPGSWGSLNVKPVAQFSPFVTSANSLDYYWKVTQTGFSSIAANSVIHNFRYVDSDIRGGGVIEASYIPGVYNPYSWVYINDIAQVVDATNEIRFNNVSYVDGDYTAGILAAFQPVTVFYSCANGDWDNLSTWSNTSNAGPADATVFPGAGNPVVIGDGLANNHVVNVTTNNKIIGGLQINTVSTLDITTTTGHNFGAIPDSKVTGTGLLRISSAAATAAFPGGDFGNFLASGGGTVEYYTTALAFTLPVANTYYNNLILSPAAQIITMPNTDLTVYGDFSTNGIGTAYLNPTANSRTFTVEGDINISSGTLQFRNGSVQNLYANNDVNIASGAVFNAGNLNNAVNNLYISGNLGNNGTFDMYASATRASNVYFIGDADKVISGTGTNEFNYLIVDKGASRNTILNVTADDVTLSGAGTALILNNGTFRVSNPGLDFTLSTTTSFTIPNTAALSVNEGTVTIGTTNDNGDLILIGRLEIINNGRVNIGNGNNVNNDIEYAPGGNPEIIVSGNGVLFVNGQIRRPTTIASGSLSYSQNGNSTVTIDGRNFQNTRAMFEVLNTGSAFNMSGGTLTISRNFNNILYNELYLAPESSVVTGGTIVLGSASAAAGSSYNIVSSLPLWNLTIDATTTTKNANIRIYPLTVLNDLTIQGNSVLLANGRDVTIGGSLINNNSNAGSGLSAGGYQPGTTTQVTTFNGNGLQYITGAGSNLTNFANLVIEPGTSVSLASNSNIRINGNLSILSGILNDGSNTITVTGNVDNSAVHSSSVTTGGIVMYGSLKQTISGSGTGQFGNITLNNSLGIEMVDNSVINGQLTFSNGNMYIDDYLLTFGLNATIGGTPNSDNMIMLNGVISDQGVKKLYPAGAADFTFPIGVAGKYTPVRYNVTATGAAGTILVRPVNYKHPSTYENPAATNELQYYWYAVSTGFSGLTVNHEYHYDGGDALPDETDYIVGRYSPVSFSWDTPAEGTVYAASDYFELAGVNSIYGEYTCGVNIAPSPNFQDMPIYYSRNATNGGNWTDPNAWTLTADGSGGPAPSYPQGNAVVIHSGHTITLNANSQTAYSVDINGTLAAGTTLYHNLGHIRGGGIINLTSTTSGSFVFPAGVYDEFMVNATSTIEFYNNSAIAATLPLKPGNDYKPYQNVIFSGTGVKYMSAENMRVLGNLTINAGTLDNTLHNKTLTILGNWTDNNTASTGGFVPGTGSVVFNGTAAQTLTVTGASTSEQFYNFRINNAAGLTIAGAGQISVNRNLYLTLGNITTSAANLLNITYSSAGAVIGGGSLSFVNGPLRKRINSGSYFDFPVGDGNGSRYGNLYISTVSLTGNYIAQYYNHNPDDDGYDPLNIETPIDVVSNNEYWRINGPAATANVRIRWDDLSGIIPVDADSRTKLRVVEWNGLAWTNRGNVINDGGQTSGTIQTNPAVSVNGNHYFTIGGESLPTGTITSGDSSICDDGSSTSISMDLTGTAPWTIRYMINGANETTINNIATSPYLLMVSNSLEPLASQGNGDYKFNISYIRDATGSTGIRYFTDSVTITLYESPNPVIAGNTTVGYGETGVVYSSGTGNIPGHTYLWTVSAGASIASGQGTYRITVDWPESYGTAWAHLTETVTTGGCSVTTAQYEVEISDIPNPLVTGTATVCNNQTVVYRTPLLSGHTYSWSLPAGGGNIIGVSNLDSVMVQWTTAGGNSVRVDETAGSETRDNALPVTVNPLPPVGNAVSDPSICFGDTATITVTTVAAGLSLQLRLESDDSNFGAAVSSGPGGDIDILANPSITTIYNILVTNEYNCSQEIADFANVTVSVLPIPIITGSDTICQGTTVVYTTEAGMSNYTWTVTDDDGTSGHTITAGGGVTNNSVTIRWDGYEDHTVSVTYTTGAGCTAASPTELPVWVFKLPGPGPAHHIPNDNIP